MEAASTPTVSSSRGRAIGQRGRGGGRGGRGLVGRGRGGQGRGRGRGAGNGPAVHKRHKPRGGNKRAREESDGVGGTVTDEEKEKRRHAEAYFGVTSTTEGGSEQPTLPLLKKDANGKTMSAFTTLRSLLVDAAAFSEYVHEHRTKIKKGSFFNDSKATNMFLQAISNQPESMYSDFISTYKSEVVAILERMFSLYSVGKVPMMPPAHEFIIRCEQNGVRASDWAAGGIKPLVEGEEPSLLTPRELIKRLAALDPVSRLQRQIELSGDINDLARCVKKFAALLASVDEDSENEVEGIAKRLDYAGRCQVISKIVSKTRRLLSVAEKPKEEMADATVETSPEAPSDSPPKESDDARISSLSEAQLAIVQEEISRKVLQMLLKALDMRPPGSLSTPITKVAHFAEWALPHHLVAKEDHDVMVALKDRTNEDLEMQAAQLETVMKLKGVATTDNESLRAITDQLWTDGDEVRLEPSSVDVLSALAVAASPETIADDVKKIVFDRLVATQRYFSQKGTPIHMPRRSMRFLNEVRNKERAAVIAKRQKEVDTVADATEEEHTSG